MSAVTDAARLVSEDLTPQSDVHASSQYRKEVASVLARRTLLGSLRPGRKKLPLP